MIKTQTPQSSDERFDILAHDLRNIMTVMYSYLQVLERSLERQDLDKEVKIVQDVLVEMRAMNIMITACTIGNQDTQE